MGVRLLAAEDLALADQAAGKLGGAALLAGAAPEDQRVAAVFDDGLGFTVAVGGTHLRDGLKTQYATAAELPKSCERVLQSIDGAQGIELVDDKPEALVTLRAAHRLEDGEAHPGGDCGAQRADLARGVGQK